MKECVVCGRDVNDIGCYHGQAHKRQGSDLPGKEPVVIVPNDKDETKVIRRKAKRKKQ